MSAFKCCDLVKYCCCEYDAEPEKPWYDRNYFYRTVSGIGMMLGMFALMALLLFGPWMYGLGILVDKMMGDYDPSDKSDYMMECALGIFGFTMLTVAIMALGALIYGVIYTIDHIPIIRQECCGCCNEFYSGYEELRDSQQNALTTQEINTINSV